MAEVNNDAGGNAPGQMSFLPKDKVDPMKIEVLYSDKLTKSTLPVWEDFYVKRHPGSDPSEAAVWEHALMFCESSFSGMLNEIMTLPSNKVIAISLQENNGSRVIAIKDIEALDEVFDMPTAIAFTLYIKDDELMLETIHNNGVDYTMFRELKTSVTDTGEKILKNSILNASNAALELLVSQTWQLGRQFRIARNLKKKVSGDAI